MTPEEKQQWVDYESIQANPMVDPINMLGFGGLAGALYRASLQAPTIGGRKAAENMIQELMKKYNYQPYNLQDYMSSIIR